MLYTLLVRTFHTPEACGAGLRGSGENLADWLDQKFKLLSGKEVTPRTQVEPWLSG